MKKSSFPRPRIALAALLFSLVLNTTALSAPGNQAPQAKTQVPGVTDNQITFASCVPLSGILKERADAVTTGANLYFSHINDSGGVFGRKLKLQSCDDGYDPEKAIVCFNTCIKDNIFAGMLFIGSAPIAKYVRMADASKIPMLGFCTGSAVIYDFHPTEFTIRPSYGDEVAAMIDNLCGKLGLKKIGIIYQSDAFGAAVRESAEHNLSRYHLTPIVEASYSRNTSEVLEATDRVRQSAPEAVILGATSDKLISMIKAKKEKNWKTDFVAFSVANDYLETAGSEADGVVVAQSWPSLDEHLPSIALYTKLRKKYTPNAKPNLSTLEGMLNAMVAVEALKRAGKDITRERFIAALESMHSFDLGLGSRYMVGFNANNHNGLNYKSVYFTQVKNGKLSPMNEGDWKLLKGPS